MMKFEVDFFRDEVRSGFYVPTAIKQAWAAGLNVLLEIDRVCKKHEITYFLDWGSMLGSVRHKGFIPWDDDVDICMLREDYRHFRDVADDELPEGYRFHDYERSEDHWTFPVGVVNREKICYEPEYLNANYNFPWLVGVDIFVKDHLYDDDAKEKERDDELMHIFTVADQIVNNQIKPDVKKYWLREFEQRHGIRFSRKDDIRQTGIELFRLAEALMGQVKKDESGRIGQIYPDILRGRKPLPSECYEKAVYIPFEELSLPVACGYDMIMTNNYGDYMCIHKGGGSHNYPYYEAQREELQKQADFQLPEYKYDPATKRQGDGEEAYRASLKGMCEECLAHFDELYTALCHPDTTADEQTGILEESQQLAADLGELVDTVKGAESETAGKVSEGLQAYCDGIYELYVIITGQQDGDSKTVTEQLGSKLDQMKKIISNEIINRKEVLFLATDPKLWSGFGKLYESEINAGADVTVLALPVKFKDCYGRIKDTETEEEIYPDAVRITPWESYDISLHYPDRVYIQDAYDGENPCLSIPPQYYSSNIRDLCRELILVPALIPDEFTAADTKEMYNMKSYVTVPGVVYADKVLLAAPWLKQRYLDKLCAWAGEETRPYWDSKLDVTQQ